MTVNEGTFTNNYGIYETERHLHSNERWYGAAVTPSGETHVADRIGVGVVAFQIDAGNNNWGSWLQVLGSSDTPADAGGLYFDGHRIQISAAERTAVYFIQFSAAETAAAGLTALTYTEFVYKPASVQGKPAPIVIQTRRAAAGTKLWARCMCPLQNTATLDFFFGVHEYER
jgi:hypothetical protein